jgi:hypothetical protein
MHSQPLDWILKGEDCEFLSTQTSKASRVIVFVCPKVRKLLINKPWWTRRVRRTGMGVRVNFLFNYCRNP